MSWKIKEKYRKTLAAEDGNVIKDWGGKLSICLVYPNHYATAMGNLGFHSVYSLCNSFPDVVCERAFLPDAADLREYEKSGSRLLSLETQRPLSDFDVIAFSVSFENDYLNIPTIFHLSGIPPFSSERDSSFPLVIAGGAALFLNPEPVAELLDMVCVGEGEAILPPLLQLLRTEQRAGRGTLQEKAAAIPGVYIPSLYSISHEGSRVTSFTSLQGAPHRVKRTWAQDLTATSVTSVIFAPGVEFSDMYLIELSRGCPRGCRFCAAGFIYHPYRQRSLELLKQEAARGLELKGRLGLVGAAVSDFREIGALSRYISGLGGKASVSSLRIDALDEDLLDLLCSGGHKTIALAPEGGSQRLRDLVRKGINEAQILDACDTLIGRDILNLKLYFIIGLPTETEEDLGEMTSLIEKIRERVITAARKNRRLGSVLLSVNPFIPKPFTPLQWCGMEELPSLERKYAFLRRFAGGLSNVEIRFESLREAYLQSLLSRGGRGLAALLVQARKQGSWKRAARDLAIDTDYLVHRTIPLDETLPWDIIDGGDRNRLVAEYEAALGRG
ncbi:MAG: radical SAM protein [Deltaproteobacteria bacterium]|nr:radical SAM protein [Deltaproteobacteria bacterium]